MALKDKLTVEAQIEVSDILYPLSQDEEVEFAVRVFGLLAAPAQFVDEIRYRLLGEMDLDVIADYLRAQGYRVSEHADDFNNYNPTFKNMNPQ